MLKWRVGSRGGHGFHVVDAMPPVVTFGARTLSTCPTSGTLSPLFHVSQDESDSVCILLLFRSSFFLNPSVFAMSVSHSFIPTLSTIRVGEKQASLCLGISVLSFSIKIHGQRTKITSGFLGG